MRIFTAKNASVEKTYIEGMPRAIFSDTKMNAFCAKNAAAFVRFHTGEKPQNTNKKSAVIRTLTTALCGLSTTDKISRIGPQG